LRSLGADPLGTESVGITESGDAMMSVGHEVHRSGQEELSSAEA